MLVTKLPCLSLFKISISSLNAIFAADLFSATFAAYRTPVVPEVAIYTLAKAPDPRSLSCLYFDWYVMVRVCKTENSYKFVSESTVLKIELTIYE